MQKSIQKQVNSRGQCLFSSYTHSLYTRRIPVIVSYLQFYLNTSWLQGWIAIIPHQEGKKNNKKDLWNIYWKWCSFIDNNSNKYLCSDSAWTQEILGWKYLLFYRHVWGGEGEATFVTVVLGILLTADSLGTALWKHLGDSLMMIWCCLYIIPPPPITNLFPVGARGNE